MEHYTLKSKKQDNGLWGIPMNIKSIDFNTSLPTDEKEILISAIICGMGENYHPHSISMNIYDYYINFEIDESKTRFAKLDSYGIINNTLYFFRTDEDKIQFNRIQKLNKIKDELISTVANDFEEKA